MSVGSLLSKIFGGSIIKDVTSIIDNLTTTDAEKLEAKRKLLELEASLQLSLAEIDAQLAAAQRDVVVAEAEGKSWLQRNWRPIIMLFFAVCIGTVIWTGGYINGQKLDPEFVADLMSTIKLGIGGYIIGRSAEKIAPSVVDAVKNNKK